MINSTRNLSRTISGRVFSYVGFPLSAVAALVAMPSPAAADSMVRAVGSSDGGVPFRARCAEGEILTGLAYRAGNEFDAITPICARADRPNSVIPASVRTYPQMFGGTGGRADIMQCGRTAPAIRNMLVDAWREDHRVKGVSIFCGPVSAAPWEPPPHPHAAYSGTYGGDGGIENFGRLIDASACPPGEVGVGIHGRSGVRVDQLGLICGTPVTAQAVTPPPVSLPGSTRPDISGPKSMRPRPRPQVPR